MIETKRVRMRTASSQAAARHRTSHRTALEADGLQVATLDLNPSAGAFPEGDVSDRARWTRH